VPGPIPPILSGVAVQGPGAVIAIPIVRPKPIVSRSDSIVTHIVEW